MPRFWELVERHRINFFSAVPTLYAALLQQPTQGRDIRLAAVRTVRRGSDAGRVDAQLPGKDGAEDPRGLWPDRGRLRQHLQSSSWRTPPRLDRTAHPAAADEGRGAGRRGRVRARLRRRRSGSAGDPRTKRVRGLQGARAQQRAMGRCRRRRAMVEHRRPRSTGRRRLLLPHGQKEGTDHSRRPQHRSGEHRGAAAQTSGRADRSSGRAGPTHMRARSRSPSSSSSQAPASPRRT